MFQTISKSTFIDAFREARREDNFSYEGRCVLFDYFEALEEECDTQIELDVIAHCVEYSESSWDQIARDYNIDVEGLDSDEIEDAVRDYLEDHTTIVGDVPGGCVFVSF